MANYNLLASEATVQVLSPTVVRDVIYATIETIPSGVIASTPVDTLLFFQETVSSRLASFAQAIESIMVMPGVIGATGTQSLDPTGLIQDEVTFICEYVPAGGSGTAITAEAVVPVSDLQEARATTSGGGIAQAEAIVNGVLASLQAMASG